MKNSIWKIVLTVIKYGITLALGVLGSDEITSVVTDVM